MGTSLKSGIAPSSTEKIRTKLASKICEVLKMWNFALYFVLLYQFYLVGVTVQYFS